MIQVNQMARCLLLPDRKTRDGLYWKALEQQNCYVGSLIIECVAKYSTAMCPRCVTEADHLPAGGAGVVICYKCGYPFVALLLPADKRPGGWYCFPVPRK